MAQTVVWFIVLSEYLLQNMDWLEEELGGYDDDYLIFDCPGQIELYTHHPFLPTLVQNLSRMGIRTCAVYLLESQFMEDRYNSSVACYLQCLPWSTWRFLGSISCQRWTL